jgi:hypothetical protein
MKHTLTHHETAASPARSERSKSRIYPCFDSGHYVNRERPGQGGNLSRAGQHADCWHPLTGVYWAFRGSSLNPSRLTTANWVGQLSICKLQTAKPERS